MLPGFDTLGGQGELDLSGIDDNSFFAEAEQCLFEALHKYAAFGAGAQAARRRLFADDAGQGVALLELLRCRYDVVLMNPPFGACSLAGKKFSKRSILELITTSLLRLSNEVWSFFMLTASSAPSPHELASSYRLSKGGVRNPPRGGTAGGPCRSWPWCAR